MRSIPNEHTGLNKFNARNASCFALSMHVYICMYIDNHRVIAISCICFGTAHIHWLITQTYRTCIVSICTSNLLYFPKQYMQETFYNRNFYVPHKSAIPLTQKHYFIILISIVICDKVESTFWKFHSFYSSSVWNFDISWSLN